MTRGLPVNEGKRRSVAGLPLRSIHYIALTCHAEEVVGADTDDPLVGDVEAAAREFGDEFLGGEPVFGGVVEQRAVGAPRQRVAVTSSKTNSPPGFSTRAVSSSAARQSGMWWMIAKSNTAS